MQGHEPDSLEFHAAVLKNFGGIAAPDKGAVRSDDLPKMEEGLGSPPVPRRERIVSAPVSRETMATGNYNSYGERPGRVTMTPAMKEAARIAGISETEYAANVLRLREEKAKGHYGGQS
jgi:hypothetical protein